MNKILSIYRKCEKIPFGKKIFSRLVCFKAPYFGTIKPIFVELRPGYCEIVMKKRRAVQNHLKSVHAIAMCNISELTAGLMLDITLPSHLRWIPKGMSVEYLKFAKTDLRAKCEITANNFDTIKEFPMTVHVTDTNNTEVFRAVINMHISSKK